MVAFWGGRAHGEDGERRRPAWGRAEPDLPRGALGPWPCDFGTCGGRPLPPANALSAFEPHPPGRARPAARMPGERAASCATNPGEVEHPGPTRRPSVLIQHRVQPSAACKPPSMAPRTSSTGEPLFAWSRCRQVLERLRKCPSRTGRGERCYRRAARSNTFFWTMHIFWLTRSTGYVPISIPIGPAGCRRQRPRKGSTCAGAQLCSRKAASHFELAEELQHACLVLSPPCNALVTPASSVRSPLTSSASQISSGSMESLVAMLWTSRHSVTHVPSCATAGRHSRAGMRICTPSLDAEHPSHLSDLMRIRNVVHKGLRRLIEDDDTSWSSRLLSLPERGAWCPPFRTWSVTDELRSVLSWKGRIP